MELPEDVVMTKHFVSLLMLFVVWPSFAADLNGYTAQYECRAGGPQCNVDVATYVTHACDTTITTADSMTAITDKMANNQYICVTNGDYTSKGTWELPNSGTSGAYKVLRYYRSGDNNDEPWNQTSGNQAKVAQLNANGKDYWIIHRLTFPTVSTSEHILVKTAASTDIIFNRIWSTGFYGSSEGHIVIDGGTRITVQNSVIANSQATVNASPGGILFGCSTDTHIVNNEIYDVAKSVFTWQSGCTEAGSVVENNDMYLTTAYYTAGNTKSKAEGFWSTKANGSAAAPYRVIHNRSWGMRPSDTSTCCDGGGAAGLGASIGGGAATGDYILYQNNIDTDSEGILEFNSQQSSGTNNSSIVGNLFYKFRKYMWDGGALTFYSYGGALNTAHEVYLNSFIDANNTAWLDKGSASNIDLRCNVVISSAAATGTWGSGSQMDYNVYYDTTDSGETNKIVKSITTRANSKAYNVGNILRTAVLSNCVNGTESACFLYKVIQAGTSAGSAPSYCTTLGCTQSDGNVMLQAIRGPYLHKRKLRTLSGGELAVIPYAQVHTSALEYGSCPGGTNVARPGIRQNIGISDSLLY